MASRNSLALDLECRRVDLLYRQNLTAPLVILMVSSVFVFLAWHSAPHHYLVVWASLWGTSAILRTYATARWDRARSLITSFDQLKVWVRLMFVGCAVTGVFLGILAVIANVYLTGEQQVLTSLLIIGSCSGAMTVYSPSRPCALAILLLAIIPWTGMTVFFGHDWLMGFCLTFYTTVNVRLVNNWNEDTRRKLHLNLELHQHREKLRLALDSSGASSWEWDPVSLAFSCDANAEKILGIPVLRIRSLEDYLRSVHPDDRDMVEQAFLSIPSKEVIDLEHRITRPDGSESFLSMRGQAQISDQGRPLTVTGIFYDITSKKNEEKLRFEQDLFEKANKAKLVFLANVSHEIRTPLTAINGFAENILTDGELPAKLKDHLNVILRSGKYLASVVHDLLDLSKAETDNIYIQKTLLVLADEINDSLHVVRSAIERKNLNLEVIYDTPIPETITSDPTRLRQILINLLSNAVKYTEHGKIALRLSFETLPEGGRLHIIVSDTGIGMTMADRRKLFQPFARGETAQVQRQPGSGLGLALARALALRIGGDLRLHSSRPRTEFNDGFTAFELTVESGPFNGVQFAQTHSWTSASSHTSPLSAARPFHGRKFLLAEDDEDIRWLMNDFLAKKGARVETCVHGGEAVELASRSHFDAILMDIKMPVMDGYQATSLLRQKGYRNSIVALTAHANSSDQLQCYQAGCDFYLSKPVNFAHLQEVLCKCFEARAPLSTDCAH